jgi:hypothetical protein
MLDIGVFSQVRVGPPGLEPGTYGLKVRYSAIELRPLGFRAGGKPTARSVPTPRANPLGGELYGRTARRPRWFYGGVRTVR